MQASWTGANELLWRAIDDAIDPQPTPPEEVAYIEWVKGDRKGTESPFKKEIKDDFSNMCWSLQP